VARAGRDPLVLRGASAHRPAPAWRWTVSGRPAG